MELDYVNAVKANPCPPKPKTPVEVLLKCNTDGKITPLYIKWKTGKIYKVDKVLDIKPRGPDRMTFHLRIKTHSCYLYYEKRKWFVNEKTL